MSTIADLVAAAIAAHPRMTGIVSNGPVTVESFGGSVGIEDLKRISRRTPIILVSRTGVGQSGLGFGNALLSPLKMAIDIVASGPHQTPSSGMSRHERVERLEFILLKLLSTWQTDVTNSSEVAPVSHLGTLHKPENVTSDNKFSTNLDKLNLAWCRITYTANYGHPESDPTDFEDWDLLHSEHAKDEWREGVVVDPDDENVTTETDMSP